MDILRVGFWACPGPFPEVLEGPGRAIRYTPRGACAMHASPYTAAGCRSYPSRGVLSTTFGNRQRWVNTYALAKSASAGFGTDATGARFFDVPMEQSYSIRCQALK